MKIMDRIILELLENEENEKRYINDYYYPLEDVTPNREIIYNFIANSQNTIQRESKRLIIRTLDDEEFDKSKINNENYLKLFFNKYTHPYYDIMRSILFDYYIRTIQKRGYYEKKD